MGLHCCYILTSLWTLSQWILSNNSLSIHSFALLKFRVLTPFFCQAHIPRDHELKQGIVAATQAASDLNLCNSLFHIGEHQFQVHFTTSGSVQYLTQKVVRGLQETPGLLSLNLRFFPAAS